jgi:hypothetical protein
VTATRRKPRTRPAAPATPLPLAPTAEEQARIRAEEDRHLAVVDGGIAKLCAVLRELGPAAGKLGEDLPWQAGSIERYDDRPAGCADRLEEAAGLLRVTAARLRYAAAEGDRTAAGETLALAERADRAALAAAWLVDAVMAARVGRPVEAVLPSPELGARMAETALRHLDQVGGPR